MIIGLTFATAFSIINMQISPNCPDIITRIVWATNAVLIIVMVAVFLYGVYLASKSGKNIKRKRRLS